MKDVRKLVIAAVKYAIADLESKINILSASFQTETVEALTARYKGELSKYKGLLHELQTENAVILTTCDIWSDD